MNEKIRETIEELFADAPRTRAAVDMKEEIISNAEEKMKDLLAQGYREEDAFAVVIHSIGNVEELFEELRNEGGENKTVIQDEKVRRKKAVITAVSVGLYILAGVVFFFFGMVGELGVSYAGGLDLIVAGFIIAGALCIPPTCMLVYSSIMYPAYKKKEDSMVEEYKEWKNGSSRDKAIRGAVSTIIWTLGIAIYFIVSFRTFEWQITWVIFLILGCLEGIVTLIFSLKNRD